MKADSGYTQASICTNGRVTEPHVSHSSQLAAAAQNLAPHQGQRQAQVTPQGLPPAPQGAEAFGDISPKI